MAGQVWTKTGNLPTTFPTATTSTPIIKPLAPTQWTGGVERDAVVSSSGYGTSGDVNVYDPVSGAKVLTIPASSLYGSSFYSGVVAVTGDVNNDGIPDVIVAPASGNNPVVKIFDGVTGQLIGQFNPYADQPYYYGGARIAVGDVNGDGHLDIIVGPGSGNAPVRVFNGQTFARIGTDFLPFGAQYFSQVSLAVANPNVHGGPTAGLIVAAGLVNGVPTIRSFSFDPVANQFVGVPGSQFQAFTTSTSVTPSITTGDVNGDGKQDIIVSEQLGTTVFVEAFDTTGHPLTKVLTAATNQLSYEPTTVVAHDVNGDGTTDFISVIHSVYGMAGNVTKLGLSTGLPAQQYAALAGNLPDLAGQWLVGTTGGFVTIAQNGQDVLITDQNGHISQSTLYPGVNYLVTTAGEVARIDNGVLQFTDGNIWVKAGQGGPYMASVLGLTGSYTVTKYGVAQSTLATVTNSGIQLTLANGSSNANAVITNPGWLQTGISLTATFQNGAITFYSGPLAGQVWKRLAVAPQWTTSTGGSASIASNGTGVTFTDQNGNTSPGIWQSPTQLSATAFNKTVIVGTGTNSVAKGTLKWSDGTTWSTNVAITALTSGSTSGYSAGIVTIHATPSSSSSSPLTITVTDANSNTSHLSVVASGILSGLDGKLKYAYGSWISGKLYWSNGEIWSNLDTNQMTLLFDLGTP